MYNIFRIQNFTSGFHPYLLYFFVFFAIISGIFIITSKNPVISVMFLISLFANIACYLISIGQKFLGLSYLLVYVGAVSILFLFILMLINIRVSELSSDTSNSIPLSILVILAFFVPISSILPTDEALFDYESIVLYVSSWNWDGTISDVSDIVSIGNVMYTQLSMWLILVSIILLVAMIGSIIITIKQTSLY
jgi:NADH-ubiquinone oxidoreductase chain 6